MQFLEHSVIRVLNARGTTVGTGFVVTDLLAVTCAHAVQAAGSACEKSIYIEFYANQTKVTAEVLKEGWSPPDNDDIAFLRLASLPEGVTPVVMGTATQCRGHSYFSFGFAKIAGYDNRPVNGIIDGLVSVSDRHKGDMLQLQGEAIDLGLSGAPVLDTKTDRVIGMMSEYKDNQQTRFAWITTADTIALALSVLDQTFQLWPETFGPSELDLYLRYLIDSTQRIRLPDGHEVQLERIYVSLRTTEMKKAEWEAEKALHLDDVETMRQAASTASIANPYTEFEVVSRAIARYPKALKLTARDWKTLFAVREKGLLSLAKVVQGNSHVMILGDPGSGKTTLGRWLALQYARALLLQETHVKVQADLVQLEAESETLLDLGHVRLPLLVRIADYAHARWTTEDRDTHLPLERFLGRHENRQDRPSSLTQDVIQAIAFHYLALGQALVILDGLDEVADLDRRRMIMHEVKRFLQEPSPAIDLPTRLWAENQVMLTSRIVGYQIEPLADLPHYTIEDMDESSITAFCGAWMQHVPLPPLDTETAATHAQALKTAIFHYAHPGVRSIAGNPLLLTLLAQTYWKNPQHTLPASRVALFEEVTRLMYDQREHFWKRSRIPLLRLNRALGAVAAYIHASEPTGFTDEGRVHKALRTILSDSEQVEAVLEAAREVSGFLIARGSGVYGFTHRSLLEYFVALHLTDIDQVDDEAAQHMINRLAMYALDPSWREPVVLAVGIISRAKHPENRELGNVLKSLLAAPDPVGAILPRRELLAAAACVECERVPQGFGHRIAEHLLACYAEREGRVRSPVMRKRILQAFHLLQRCPVPVPVETETVVRDAIEGVDFERRYAGIDLLIKTQWDTPLTASALVTAWKTYADPAGSLLTALEGIQKRNPACFSPITLPMRQDQYIWVWEKALHSQEWQAILRVLYLSPEVAFTQENVNRDSPLTGLVLAALNQVTDSGLSVTLRQDLVAQAEHPGTAEARDAALIMSALDDASWVRQGVVAVNRQERIMQGIFAALAYWLVGALNVARYHSRIHALEFVSNFARVRALDHARDLASDLALDNDLDRALDRAGDLDLARALDLDLAYTLDVNFARALDLDLARARVLVQETQQVQQRWAGDDLFVKQLDSVMETFLSVQMLYQVAKPLANVWEALLTACREPHYPEREQEKEELAQRAEHVTLESLVELLNDLGNVNDTRREQARQVLLRLKDASHLGKQVIERMAILAHEYRANPQVGTQLEWALHRINHDVPDWIESWIEQADGSEQVTPVLKILGNIHRITPETFHILVKRLPHTSFAVKSALLESLRWLVRLNELSEQAYTTFFQNLLNWLHNETDDALRSSIIEVLSHCRKKETATVIAHALLPLLEGAADDQNPEIRALEMSLARLASIQEGIRELVKATLSREGVHSDALPAHVRLSIEEIWRRSNKIYIWGKDQIDIQNTGTALQAGLVSIIPNPVSCFDALLDAGTDDDIWDDSYHGVLAITVQRQVEQFPDLVPRLLAHLEHALDQQDWPARRISLAAVAACTESLPAKLQQAAHGKLEALLVRGTTDAESFNSRRHALTALSYLRTVTPKIVPALLDGCRDIEIVQQAAIEAARRFHEIQGDVLSDLTPWLIGESVNTAYAVAQLLSALGTSTFSEVVGIREQIIKALVEALQNSDCQREVVIEGQNKGTLEDVLCTVLLNVEGWVA